MEGAISHRHEPPLHSKGQRQFTPLTSTAVEPGPDTPSKANFGCWIEIFSSEQHQPRTQHRCTRAGGWGCGPALAGRAVLRWTPPALLGRRVIYMWLCLPAAWAGQTTFLSAVWCIRKEESSNLPCAKGPAKVWMVVPASLLCLQMSCVTEVVMWRKLWETSYAVLFIYAGAFV